MKRPTYKTWSRKGKCPGCGVGTGCKHKDGCATQASMLADLVLDKEKAKRYYPILSKKWTDIPRMERANNKDWAHLLVPSQYTVWIEGDKLFIAQGIHNVEYLRGLQKMRKPTKEEEEFEDDNF